jgi:NAD(P)-dependent dehydrogenase (short-subunit alcohol dehydrogenase family)
MADKGIFDLSGKVALVTGASRGIGRAIATVLAEYGADVACVGRDMKACEITLGQVRAHGRKALPLKAEMKSEEDIKKMVEDTIKEFGKIDILFNNAGGGAGYGKIHEIATDDWDFTINTNLRGTFLCMRYTIPYMLKNKGGSIINISSVAGVRAEVPEIGSASYGASKAGINNLTQVAAMHYAKDNIKVNAIAPGMHRSEIGRTGLTEEENKERDKFLDEYCAEWIPMGRLAEAEELAGLVVLLASDASSYITGQIICQDGGKTARQ